MHRRNLSAHLSAPSAVLALMVLFVAAELPLRAQAQPLPEPAGLLAVHAGTIDAPAANSFKGSAFLVSRGWAITARHVVDQITEKHGAGELFVTLGSREPGTNPIKLTELPWCPDDAIDICLLKLDAADVALDSTLARPFDVSCRKSEVSAGQLDTTGFGLGSTDLFSTRTVQISGWDGYFDYGGTRYRHLIRAQASTPDGLSGAPGVIPGTRRVVGVHAGLTGGNQVISPIYNLNLPLVRAGEVVLRCGRARDGGPERVTSYILKYTGQSSGYGEDEVGRMINYGVDYIRDQILQRPGIGSDFTYIEYVGQQALADPLQNRVQLDELWHADSGRVLQILYGHFSRGLDPAQPIEVESTIFLGDLPDAAGRDLQRNQFGVISHNRVSDFKRIADGHHLVMLYALLLDAVGMNKPPNVVLALVSVSDYVADELRRSGNLEGDLAYIAGEIAAIGAEYAP